MKIRQLIAASAVIEVDFEAKVESWEPGRLVWGFRFYF